MLAICTCNRQLLALLAARYGDALKEAFLKMDAQLLTPEAEAALRNLDVELAPAEEPEEYQSAPRLVAHR